METVATVCSTGFSDSQYVSLEYIVKIEKP